MDVDRWTQYDPIHMKHIDQFFWLILEKKILIISFSKSIVDYFRLFTK